MNINGISRKAVRVIAAVLVAGFGCLLASCGGGGDGAPGLQSLELTPPNAQAAAGTLVSLSATGIYSDGTHKDVTNQVIWASSDRSIAAFGAGSGATLSAVATGTVTIAATLHDRVGTTNFTVTPAVLVSMEVTPATPSVANGITAQFTATGIFSDRSTQDLTTQVTWASANTAIVVISNVTGSAGLASTVGVGSTTITATSGGISGSTTFMVTAATLRSLLVTPFNSSLPKGVSRQFTATGVFSDNSTHDITAQVTWSSSQPGAATVSSAAGSAGLVTATAAGVSIISATTASGLSATSPVTVTAAALVSIQITPNDSTIVKGLTGQFTAMGTYTDNSTQSLTNQVTWASSNSGVATLSNASGSNGLANTAGVGATTVSAAIGKVSGNTTLNVSAAELVSIQVTPDSPGIGNGLTEQFTATGTYTDNSKQYLTTQVTWASSNTGAATISNAAGSNGLATSSGLGTTTISAMSGNISASTLLTVRQPPHLYVADYANIYICSINITDGSLTGCAATGNGFQSPFGIVLTGSGQAYVSNAALFTGPSVSVCNVAADGSLTSCSIQAAANVSQPLQLAVSGSTLYAIDGGVPGVTYCTILADGSLSNCNLTATDFNSLGIAVGAGTIYLSNNSGWVNGCAIDTNGSLGSCAGFRNGLSYSSGLSLTGNRVYVVDANPASPSVNVCPINPDGTLGTCAASALPAMANPIAVLTVGSHAYVSDQTAGIYLCAVSPADGSLSNCTVSNGGASFYYVSQMAIY